MTSPANPQDKPKRRSPISREEGERRLVRAALELLRERPFSEVGVRDIAARADVNHGFVHTWFGSKNDLLMRVTAELFEVVSISIAESPAGGPAIRPFDPDTNLLVRLVAWLKLENADISSLMKNQRIVNAFTERYTTVDGLRPDVAHVAAQQVVAMGIAIIAFGELIEVSSNADVTNFLDQWRYILGLLVKYPPA